MKKFLSALLIMSLLAGSIVSGLRLSLRFASADDAPVENLVSLSDIKSYIESNVDVSVNSSWGNFWTFVQNNWESQNTLITVASNISTFNFDCIKICLMQTNSTGAYRWANDSSGNLITKGGSFNYFRTVGFLWYYGDNSWGVNYQPGNYTISRFNNNITFDSNQLIFAPTGVNLNSTSVYTWCNHIVEANNNNIPLQLINLQWDSIVPPIIEFDIVVFWIGTRRYLTIKDQSLIRQLNGGGLMDYIFEVDYFVDSETQLTATYEYSNLVLISYPGDIAYELENVSPLGIYCIDITNHPATIISAANIYDTYTLDDYLVAECVNCPYVLQEEAPEPGSDGTPDPYVQAWSVYNEYVSNYNTTSIVPESLSDRIFSTSGAKTLPAEILIPDSLVTSSGTAVVNPVFLWSFGSQVDGDVSVIDYSLCDVCVIPYNQTSYAMKFWYGSGVAQQFSSIDTFEFDRILDMYDVILIVNSYPDFLFDSGVPGPGSVYSRGFTGTSSDMQYVDAISIGTVGDQRFSCFAIITERCLQKTQLYNFSDGISKVYELMCDYVQSEDDWKASFLLWSSAVFSSIDSLNGKLDEINTSIKSIDIEGIIERLDRIAANTSEEESNFWYEPLFWFVDQFKPALSDFTNSIDAIDTSWDTMPLLPELSPVPTIPLIGGG